ncbi:MAG TPA: DoxX family protein [Gammaproteobacteria bacterium]|nr:DoxX family protein [Gammaproteobacteria bacterium]
MTSRDYEDAGKLLLRLLVGGLLILHGVHKIINGPSEIDSLVASAGFPAFFGGAVYVGEVLAPILVLVGYYTRVGGLLILINLICAVLLTRGGHVWALGPSGGWVIQLEAFFGLGGLAVFLLGAGRFSVGGEYAKWN